MIELPAYVSSRFEHLSQVSGVTSDHVLWVPGRIEVLGKHTDYAGGDSLTCASTHGMAASVLRHDRSSLIIEDASRNQRVELFYNDPSSKASWTRYPSAVLTRIIRHFGAPRSGVHIVLHSDLPSASGMSSSSALIVTVLLALLAHTDPDDMPFKTREDLAGFAGAIESGADWRGLKGDDGVGTRGGSQDHTAILCGREGMLSLFGYQPIRCHERVTLPESVSFIVAGSGVKARKTGDAKHAYNRASKRASDVARLYSEDLDEHYPHMGAMMAAPHFDRESLRWAVPDDDLWDRFQQFEREVNHVLPEAMRAVAASDWNTFGKVTAESQSMAADWLHNQIPETNTLATCAVDLGAFGASSFGAGFGGAVWALVPTPAAESFARDWKAAYAEHFPHRAQDMVILGDQPGIPAWTSQAGFLYGLD